MNAHTEADNEKPTAPLCVDCHWFLDALPGFEKCLHARPVFDPVRGRHQFPTCASERAQARDCGPAGQYFQQVTINTTKELCQ